MNDQPPRRRYRHFSELPYSLRSLYTATLLILGMGYLFALANIYFSYAGKAGGNPLMLSYEDIVVGYAGNEKGSIIESALNGPMSAMAPPDERSAIIAWVRAGASQASYLSEIKPILDQRCMACHDGSNPQLTNLSTYDGLKKVAEVDTGPSAATLVRYSHIHLFGIAFIFFAMGLMFSHAYVRPVWFKSAVIVTPFATLALDIGSMFFIRLYHPFAAVTIASGAVTAACFAIMWLITMYQMWFSKPPEAILRRMGGDLPDEAT